MDWPRLFPNIKSTLLVIKRFNFGAVVWAQNKRRTSHDAQIGLIGRIHQNFGISLS
jgi:hypothetical protein